MLFSNYQQELNHHIKSALNHTLSALSDNTPKKLFEAMTYSLSHGGKYIRPLLVYATGESFGASRKVLDIPAISLELIHTYSLIHDDLPSMDNADLRRGIPSCHKKFGEGTAILVGDALLSLSFELLSQNSVLPDSLKIKMISMLANAAGPNGMVGGQSIDIDSDNIGLDIDDLIGLHQRKTGALIKAAILFGAYAANIEDMAILTTLETIADNLGLAYQIQDDILDVESSAEILGKTPGIDTQLNKTTFPKLLGLNASKKMVMELFNDIHKQLNALPLSYDYLPQLMNSIIHRNF